MCLQQDQETSTGRPRTQQKKKTNGSFLSMVEKGCGIEKILLCWFFSAFCLLSLERKEERREAMTSDTITLTKTKQQAHFASDSSRGRSEKSVTQYTMAVQRAFL